MTEGIFITPSAPVERWEDLSANERQWIEFIRVISVGRDPGITLKRVQALRELLDAG